MTKDGNSMSVGSRVSNAAFSFPEEDDEEVEDGVIHVLVAVAGMVTGASLIEPHPIRRRQWD